MKLRAFLSAIACAAMIAACALPPSDIETAGFVTDKELLAVGLTREALGYMKQSRYVDAELHLRQALYLFPDADNIKENLALALAGGDQTEEAIEIFQSLAAKYPTASRYYVNLGQTYYYHARYDEARATFRQALELAIARADNVAAATVLRSISVLEFRIGNEEAAVCRSQESLYLQPNAPEAIRHARMLLSLQRFPAVGQALEPYLAAAPDLLADIDRLLALAAYGQEQYDSAQSYAQHILDSQTGEFENRDEVELVAYLAARKKTGVTDAPTTEEVQKISMLSQTPSEFQMLYWPPNFVADFLAIQQPVLGETTQEQTSSAAKQ